MAQLKKQRGYIQENTSMPSVSPAGFTGFELRNGFQPCDNLLHSNFPLDSTKKVDDGRNVFSPLFAFNQTSSKNYSPDSTEIDSQNFPDMLEDSEVKQKSEVSDQISKTHRKSFDRYSKKPLEKRQKVWPSENFDHSEENVRFNQRPKILKNSPSQAIEFKILSKLHSDFQDLDRKGDPYFYQPTRCLMAKGFDSHRCTIQEFYNLIRNYGNIDLLVVFPAAKKVFIKFQCFQGANQAMINCQKFNIRGRSIKLQYIYFAENHEAQLCRSVGITLARFPGLAAFISLPSPSCQRFKLGYPLQANPISRTLHVSVFFSVARRYIETAEIVAFLERQGTTAPKRLQRDLKKDNINMWFMEWQSSRESLEVIMKCHDLKFDNFSNLRVSFTRSSRD